MPTYQAIYPRGLLRKSLHNKSVCGSMAVIILALVLPACSGFGVDVFIGAVDPELAVLGGTVIIISVMKASC